MLRICEIFCFVGEDSEGEGLIGELIGDTWVPFVCADFERVKCLRPRAESIAKTTGKTIKIIRFRDRHVVGILDGK